MFCRELAAQVRGVSDEIAKKGADVVFVGNGSPAMAKAFAEDFDVKSPLYTDPSLEAYKAASLQRGMGSIWSSIKKAPRALGGGFFQGLTKGDALQQGGIFVIGTDGSEVYRYASKFAGDHPELSDLIAALP
jgi:AhpC/TSA antioxidant enzyme